MKSFKARLTLRSAVSSGVLAAAVALAFPGCQALPPLAQQAPAAATGDETPLARSFTADVDPLHGAAFLRPEQRSLQALISAPMLIDVNFTSVTHDTGTGITTVSMLVTNAGTALTFLKCQVSGSATVVTPQWPFNCTCTAAGSSQTLELQFKNPSGGSFSINTAFTGILASDHSTQTGNGSGSVTPGSAPSSAPSSTPTPAPSASPSSAPTPTPAPSSPAGSGAFTATASSSYGTLTPDHAIDGDAGTQWANDGYQAPEAWLAIDTGSVRPITSFAVKMAPQTGAASYQVEVSDDGVHYASAAGPLRNTSWNMEAKAIPAGTQGRFVRLHFTNDAAGPDTRFSVFEVQINGTSGTPATPAPTPTPTPVPTPSSGGTPTPQPSFSPGSGSYFNDFSRYNEGTDPADFIDPRNEGYSYSWMPQVDWHVTRYGSTNGYEHNGLSNTANLSFRRYRGTAFAANGGLPDAYSAQLDVIPIQSYTYSPTGDQGTQFYYLDPTHYVELLLKPNNFEVWVCNNAPPFQSNGWSRVYFSPVNTSAGQQRTLGARIDTRSHSLTAILDGQVMTTQNLAMLSNAQPHYFALRGTGNVVVFKNLMIDTAH